MIIRSLPFIFSKLLKIDIESHILSSILSFIIYCLKIILFVNIDLMFKIIASSNKSSIMVMYSIYFLNMNFSLILEVWYKLFHSIFIIWLLLQVHMVLLVTEKFKLHIFILLLQILNLFLKYSYIFIWFIFELQISLLSYRDFFSYFLLQWYNLKLILLNWLLHVLYWSLKLR
jgi:hypothetical protein